MNLSRMDLDDAGDDPVRIAQEIHRQLQLASGPVPVDRIALGLDITEIRVEALISMEGCLVTQPERTDGAILVNANANPRRRRFTIAHELGHFLILTHQQSTDDVGFTCRTEDMIVSSNAGLLDAQKKQEAEANLFAINLLAPADRCRRFLKRIPDLEDIVDLANDLDISREAAARRYVELHQTGAAVVFARSGRVLYSARHPDFPFVTLNRGDPLPLDAELCLGDNISAHVEADAEDWVAKSHGRTLVAQRLRQERDHEMILLAFEVD